MTLTNVSPEQLAGIKNNFTKDEIFVSPAEERGKYDVNIQLQTEISAWKLFFSGSDYCLGKLGKTTVKS